MAVTVVGVHRLETNYLGDTPVAIKRSRYSQPAGAGMQNHLHDGLHRCTHK